MRTERLTIRPATREDLPRMWPYRGDDAVIAWMTSRSDSLEAFVAHLGRPPMLAKTLVVQSGEELVGDLFLAVEDAWAQLDVREQAAATQAEIGWCLHPAHTGRGYAREAARALIGLCFADLGLRRVVSNCFAANEASWRMMEDLGMRREAHTVEDSLHRELGWQDGYSYALLRREWKG
ncbi:N-acetyltransferase [Nocardioides mangrovicus]|uniref:N-acetyltransferase n=1 Tax=Nocardioides mangrovicus TaxID=2478913 RepID=A0A3L8P3Z6_9ACTN|nr:N-acetyltransferase [Nocardioides mangrovicus]